MVSHAVTSARTGSAQSVLVVFQAGAGVGLEVVVVDARDEVSMSHEVATDED